MIDEHERLSPCIGDFWIRAADDSFCLRDTACRDGAAALVVKVISQPAPTGTLWPFTTPTPGTVKSVGVLPSTAS